MAPTPKSKHNYLLRNISENSIRNKKEKCWKKLFLGMEFLFISALYLRKLKGT
jgi:hypothetical protein